MNTIPELLPAVRSFLGKPAKMLIGGHWRESATGQTLPSPAYLDHPPQYIPPSPPFPLAREQATMEAQAGAPIPGAGALIPLPPPVPPGR